MKVLTAAEMREVDRRTEEIGIAGPILMENAGHRAVEYLDREFGPLTAQRITILCGKGNNGGDGYVVARQLFTRFRVAAMHVFAAFPEERPVPRTMFEACGGTVHDSISPAMRASTIVIDALLGTGLSGPARGRALEFIREINQGFPLARVLAIDVPSGMNSDSGSTDGEVARADATITFTAPKLCHVLAPNCERIGRWEVGHIGSPASLMHGVRVHLSGPEYFRHLLARRSAETNKGTYGHVLVYGGSPGKTGAAEMTGIAALRIGAGLVTVSAQTSRPELMALEQASTFDELERQSGRMNVLAIGPGLGTSDSARGLVLEAVTSARQPCVVDADGLNLLAGCDWRASGVRVLTPHPGEMARLAGTSVETVQSDRLAVAREYASAHSCILVLKGHRTVIAMPDGRVWVNPTGTPALATGGSGDILTGLIAGLLAQFPNDPEPATIGGVWLHGRAGQMGAGRLGEMSLIATDVLDFLPEAIREAS